jgi:2-dehydropantoate 2-reductase
MASIFARPGAFDQRSVASAARRANQSRVTTMSRYIIYGAGAVGGLIGGALGLAGHDVLIIARGAHAAALAREGLRQLTPTSEHVIKLPVFTSPADIPFRTEDTVILAMKTQDSGLALSELASVAPAGIRIVCAQNGVESERLALRLFEHVYGAFVFVHCAITEDGVIASYTKSGYGILDIGKYSQGSGGHAPAIAAELREAGFDSAVRPDIMRWKRGKLLINTGNAVLACCIQDEQAETLKVEAKREAEQCYRAAELDFATLDEIGLRVRSGTTAPAIDGSSFPGSSTFQSLSRGRESTEVDYMSGEICLLGRIHGIPTPVNSLLQEAMRGMLRSKLPPQSISVGQLRELANGSAD